MILKLIIYRNSIFTDLEIFNNIQEKYNLITILY